MGNQGNLCWMCSQPFLPSLIIRATSTKYEEADAARVNSFETCVVSKKRGQWLLKTFSSLNC